jgi:hypothetical protein
MGSEPEVTDPLIDRKKLVSIIFWGGDQEYTADAVMAYLRDALTPEALSPDYYDTDGLDLHRRIFGEDA